MMPKANQPDPYNYPMPKRCDTMSLSVINQHRDGEYTHTKKFNSGRSYNQALKTTDIEGTFTLAVVCLRGLGAQPKLFGSKQVNKPEFSNQNWDIDRSGPRALHIGNPKDRFDFVHK